MCSSDLLAWKQGADAVEIDVQMSCDGRLVVIHDDTTKKTAGVDKNVCDQTFDELCCLDVGLWKGAQWRGERISGLKEVIETIPRGKRLVIELKCDSRGLKDLERVIKESGIDIGQLVLIGFSLESMALAKTMMPALEVGWVVKCNRSWKTSRWQPTISSLIDQARAANIDALDLGANRPLTRALVEPIKKAGLKLYIWTVDSPAKAKQLFDAGADGITTNRPGWLRSKLQTP